MARSKSKSKTSSGAKSSTIASRRLPDINPLIQRVLRSPTLNQIKQKILRDIEDRRTYHPAGPKRPARSFNKSQHRLVMKKASRGSRALSAKVSFHAPRKVLVCVRRERRREVIFAKAKAGAGVRRRNPKRSWYSDVSCKR